MKSSFKFVGLFFVLVCFVSSVFAQKQIDNYYQFSPKEMEGMMATFSKDAGWKNLSATMSSRSFERIKHEKAAWGFKGQAKTSDGKLQDVLFCAFDFYNPKSKKGQGGTMVWRKVGDEVYKAYLIYPEGVEDLDKALELSEEFFADASGKLQKAQSWGRCFRKCVRGSSRTVVDAKGIRFDVPSDCGTGCLASIAVCGGATAVLAVATAAPTGGLSFPVLAITFGVCAGVSCGVCLGVCALGCI